MSLFRLVALALSGALLMPAAATPALADDPAEPLISFEVQRPSGTVSGVVEVPVHVSAAAGVVPEVLLVSIGALGGERGPGQPRTRTAEVPLGPGCATGCDVVASVDTLTWLPPGTSPDAPDRTLDESTWQWVDVRATGIHTHEDGSTSPVTVVQDVGGTGFFVDNGRPELWCHQTSGYVWHVTDERTLAHTCSMRRGRSGAGLDHVEVELLAGGERRTWTVAAGAPVEGWDSAGFDVPVAELPDGVAVLRYVGVDTQGLRTPLLVQSLPVYRGPRASVDPTVHYGKLRGRSESSVRVTVPRSPLQGGRIERVFVTVDGGWVEEYLWPAVPERPGLPLVLEVPMTPEGGPVLTAGRHVVEVTTREVTATNNLGDPAKAMTSTARSVVAALQASITATPRGQAVEGGTGRLDVAVTGARDTAGSTTATPLRSWSVSRWDGHQRVGKPLASGSCTGACPSSTFPVPLGGLQGSPYRYFSEYVLRVEVKDALGRTSLRDVPVRVDAATRLRLTAPATAVSGQRVTVAIGADDPRSPIAGLPVDLQRRPAAGGAWTTVASGTTGQDNHLRVTTTATAHTQWRAVSPGKVGLAGPATSATASTSVASAVTLRGVPSSAVAGRTYTLTSTLAPVAAGSRLTVQTYRPGQPWRTVAQPRTDRSGVTATRLTFARGTTYVRVLADATATDRAGVSTTLTVSAK